MKNLIQKAVDYSLHLGADASDIIVSSSESLSLSSQKEKIEKFNVSKSSILGVRIIKNKKIGIAYSESFDEDAIHFAVKSAVENSAFADVNEHETISIKNKSDFIEKPKPTDTSSMEEKIEFAIKLESEVRKRDSRIQSVPYCGLSSVSSKSYYLNSLGTYTEEGENYLSGYTSALIQEGNISSMHHSTMIERSLKEMDLKKCIDECMEHSVNWLQAKPVTSGKYDIIFHHEVLSEILGAFSSCFSAKDAMDKINPWENKLGQTVADNRFTLIDSPKFEDAFFHSLYDSEGMEKTDLTLIDNGVLKSFYHNTVTANYFKTKSTGHASRGARSSLGVSSTNWIINPGKNSENEVTDGTYLEVIDVMGMGPGSDSITGEFSFGISGYLCKDGKRIQPVKGVTVAGNFNKLINGISKMSNVLKHDPGKRLFSPTIKFEGLYVAGK